jgi:acyl-CoA synthetase (AMP-forming)/AMP-acid ligase II
MTDLRELHVNLIRRVNVGDLVARNAAGRPDAEAVVDDGRRFTWRTFNGWVNRIARGLMDHGLGRGAALAIKARLSPYKCPKALIVVRSLPKTATGEVQKVALREEFGGSYRGATHRGERGDA